MSLEVSEAITSSLPSDKNEARTILEARISQFITRIEALEARLNRPLLTQSELTPLSTANPEAHNLAADILQLRGMARPLQTWINTLTPIGQLPPEILGKIFVHYREMCRLDDTDWSHDHWFRVSYVSHHWRAVALDTPRFWSNIWLTGVWRDRFLPRLQLERSRNEQLTVYANLRRETTQAIETSLADVLSPPYMSRIGILEVIGHPQPIYQVFSFPAESLEYLSIRFTSRPLDSAVTQELFSGETPNLRHLRLATRDLFWNSNFLRSENLTHLSIHRPSRPSFTELYGLLQALRTQLKSLNLSGVTSRAVSEIPSSGVHPVKFTRLDHFMLTDDCKVGISDSPISPFLQRVIKVPSSALLSIIFPKGSVLTSNNARDIFETISICHSPKATACKLIVLNLNAIVLQGRRKELYQGVQGWAEPPLNFDQIHSNQDSLPSFDVRVEGYHRYRTDELETFPLSCANPDESGLSLSRLETIIVRSIGPWPYTPNSFLSPTFWNNVARLPNLSTIRVVRCHMHEFIECLADDSNAITILRRREAGGDSALGGAQSAAVAVHQVRRRFASLRTIIFDSVNDFEEDSVGGSSAAMFHTLTENIRFRKGIGSPFESLQFVNCLLSEERRFALARLGATFQKQVE